MAVAEKRIMEIGGREVAVSNPGKLFFPERGITKLDLIEFYLAVEAGVMVGIARRPMVMKRYVDGAGADPFFQKRAPAGRPPWIETVELSFPSGRTAQEIVVTEMAQLVWALNLGCIDLNPHPIRADDLDHPDELRIDLDPGPDATWDQVRRVALVVREVLDEHRLVGFPKTSGSKGMHIYVRIERQWEFGDVRRAALALAREVERRAPDLATSRWWKEERHGVFLDYNQNAKDRTIASVYSVRPVPDARVSTPLAWDEVGDCNPAEFTIATVPARFAALGDLGAGIDAAVGSIESLLELAARDEASGVADAPVPRSTGRRKSIYPLLTIAKAPKEADARAGLERWKQRHPAAAALLEPADILVDAMRGRFKTWTRIRINLRHVPFELRPPEEPPDPDYDPRDEWSGS